MGTSQTVHFEVNGQILVPPGNFGVRGGSITAHPNHTPQQCVMAMCIVRHACAVAVHATRWECHVVHLHIVNAQQLCATCTILRRECAEITYRT